MPLTYDTAGINELKRVMRRLPARMETRVLASATAAAATVIRKEMEETAPADTGRLRRSIRTKRARKSDSPAHGVRYRIAALRSAFHGAILERGTADIPANPWMRRAYDNARDQAIRRWVDVGAKAVIREAKKLAGPLSKSGLLKRRRRLF